ncbi:MAG: hypothetical protein LQ341_005841 [Variospora aurantia]|nr:MAG: hypothetical protein LQ341_005841 [Variospora aurantia]
MTISFQYVVLVYILGTLIGNAHVHGEPLIEYLIWPRADINQGDVNNVENLLKSLMVEPTRLYASKSTLRPTPAFWLAELDHKTYQEVSRHPKVEEISPNEDPFQLEEKASTKVKLASFDTAMPRLQPLALGSLKDGRKIFHEKAALPELRIISQAPNTPLWENPDYVYSIDESEETFIYIPDFGINRAHWDFSNPAQKIEWLYTPQTISHHHDTPTEMQWPWPGALGSHATCVASKAAGRVAGSARHATLVVVKFWPSTAGAAEIFDTIMQDIVAKRRAHHSVVNFSFGSNGKQKMVERKQASDIMMLVRRGIPVIAGAGNGGPGFVTRFPAKLSDREDNLWGPIVVGAVDWFGEKAEFSKELQYGRMLWAPGEDIKCAAESPDIASYSLENGTSFGKWHHHIVTEVVLNQRW